MRKTQLSAGEAPVQKSKSVSIEPVLYELLQVDADRCLRTPKQQINAILKAYLSPLTAQPKPEPKSNVVQFPMPQSVSVLPALLDFDDIRRGDDLYFRKDFNLEALIVPTLCVVKAPGDKIDLCYVLVEKDRIGLSHNSQIFEWHPKKDVLVAGVYYGKIKKHN